MNGTHSSGVGLVSLQFLDIQVLDKVYPVVSPRQLAVSRVVQWVSLPFLDTTVVEKERTGKAARRGRAYTNWNRLARSSLSPSSSLVRPSGCTRNGVGRDETYGAEREHGEEREG